MKTIRKTPSTLVVIAIAAIVGGIASPVMTHGVAAVVHRINGSSIARNSIPGNRLRANTVTGKQVNESTLGAVPRADSLPPLRWHVLPLISPWVNSISTSPAAYAVDAQGIVHLRGTIHGGNSDTEAFALPVSIAGNRDFEIGVTGAGYSNDVLEIDDGKVFVEDAGATNTVTSLTSLEGATFAK